MAKKKTSTGYEYDADDDDEVAPVIVDPELPPREMPRVPEGMDEAIYKQGWDAGCKVADGAAPVENAFTAGTNQAEAWQAGYDAGSIELTPRK